ncbi:MAG: preprotein translocase subunit SecY [Candidatus Taylorbacteria bacterium RIFCSPLOWO2_12_FULL_47_20]|uniref:Protein translocase subunit SecY n=2 Tax=Candidatus Tayloriibacteriota TaxID=1817919 RepID=A0A1G2P7E8_9BACT|nr:MAG: preprotein translocase subunit SecY [Candidatus Taylorbacteria bacterium RIFCSPLOWO2_02_FULL_46_40]OHA43491.1 MAG: preprotein translocase subunit SecY [Candidatus Taylorbacteria bacterium RIFCSPLOWO2_12_FULL_47_20]
MEKLRIVFTDKSLRTRIFLTLGILALSRLLASIPIPGIDVSELQNFLSNQFIGLLNIFSGGGLSNLSVVMLGVGPYITASIIMQLLTMMSPKLKAMYQEEGQAGRLKFTQISRILTVPLALVQAFSFLAILQRQGVISPLVGFDLVSNLIVITGGSLLLMWLGELVTEFGIGNGVSLLIFSGIVAGLPQIIGREAFVFSAAKIPLYFGFLVVAMLIVVGVVIITEAERPIPITYARRVRGMKVYGGVSTYLPLRINQAGVIPIIFALSILLLPQMALSFLSGVGNEVFQKISSALLALLSNGWVYAGLYFILVFLFTYFYTAVTFDPNTISSNLQKNGAFIPGVRPGQPTSEYIAKVLTRITLVGALFLGIIAVLPLAMRALTNTPSLAIGGTALLIVVSVVLDLMKKVDAQISMREY